MYVWDIKPTLRMVAVIISRAGGYHGFGYPRWDSVGGGVRIQFGNTFNPAQKEHSAHGN